MGLLALPSSSPYGAAQGSLFFMKFFAEHPRPGDAKREPRLLIVLRFQQPDAAFGFDDDLFDGTVVEAAADALAVGPGVVGHVVAWNIGVVIFVAGEEV